MSNWPWDFKYDFNYDKSYTSWSGLLTWRGSSSFTSTFCCTSFTSPYYWICCDSFYSNSLSTSSLAMIFNSFSTSYFFMSISSSYSSTLSSSSCLTSSVILLSRSLYSAAPASRISYTLERTSLTISLSQFGIFGFLSLNLRLSSSEFNSTKFSAGTAFGAVSVDKRWAVVWAWGSMTSASVFWKRFMWEWMMVRVGAGCFDGCFGVSLCEMVSRPTSFHDFWFDLISGLQWRI